MVDETDAGRHRDEVHMEHRLLEGSSYLASASGILRESRPAPPKLTNDVVPDLVRAVGEPSGTCAALFMTRRTTAPSIVPSALTGCENDIVRPPT
jgi:hypothetical protein